MSDTKRIAVLLSGRGSNFESLLKASHNDGLGGDISLVIANRPGAGGLTIAQDAGIETALIDHQRYASREAFDRDLAATIETASPDLVVLAGFMRILTPEFVARFENRLMNIHPSLLPRYPGLNTHQRALDNRDTHAGATCIMSMGNSMAARLSCRRGCLLIQTTMPRRWPPEYCKWNTRFTPRRSVGT